MQKHGAPKFLSVHFITCKMNRTEYSSTNAERSVISPLKAQNVEA
jgi:hypothetical protein